MFVGRPVLAAFPLLLVFSSLPGTLGEGWGLCSAWGAEQSHILLSPQPWAGPYLPLEPCRGL